MRGCLFACCAGWVKGFIQSTNKGDTDDINGMQARGLWLNGGGNLQYQRWWGGYGIDNGDGVTSDSPLDFADTGTRYDIPNDAGWSAAIHIRPDLPVSDTTIPFFKRRAQPYGATEAGWSFTGGPGNTYQVRICNGVTQATVTSTTTMDPAGIRMDLLVATYDQANLRLFVNGALEATTAATLRVGNVAGEFIKFDGLGTAAAGQPTFPGYIDMGMVWKRPLARSEVSQLYSDPFFAWRDLEEPEAIGVWQTYLAAF